MSNPSFSASIHYRVEPGLVPETTHRYYANPEFYLNRDPYHSITIANITLFLSPEQFKEFKRDLIEKLENPEVCT